MQRKRILSCTVLCCAVFYCRSNVLPNAGERFERCRVLQVRPPECGPPEHAARAGDDSRGGRRTARYCVRVPSVPIVRVPAAGGGPSRACRNVRDVAGPNRRAVARAALVGCSEGHGEAGAPGGPERAPEPRLQLHHFRGHPVRRPGRSVLDTGGVERHVAARRAVLQDGRSGPGALDNRRAANRAPKQRHTSVARQTQLEPRGGQWLPGHIGADQPDAPEHADHSLPGLGADQVLRRPVQKQYVLCFALLYSSLLISSGLFLLNIMPTIRDMCKYSTSKL